MIDFFKWLKRTRVTVDGVDSLHCSAGYPEENDRRLFSELSVMDLQCPRSVKYAIDASMSNYITASYAVLISLLLALLMLVGAVLYSNRDYLVNTWTQIAEGIAIKREYTSLEKDNKRQQSCSSNNEPQEVAEVEV